MRVLGAFAIVMLLAGCAGTFKGADVLGAIGASVTLPAAPTECRQAVPHVAIAEGQELRSLLKRERAQLDVANRRIAGCAQFYDDVRAGFAGR